MFRWNILDMLAYQNTDYSAQNMSAWLPEKEENLYNCLGRVFVTRWMGYNNSNIDNNHDNNNIIMIINILNDTQYWW